MDFRPQDLWDCINDDFDADPLAAVEAYFAEVEKVAALKPDILAHIDLIKKLNANGEFFDEESPRYKAAALKALQAAKANDCLLEVDVYKRQSGNIMGGAKNPYLKATEWNWQIDPVGLRYTLNHVYDRYGLPIMITENGMGARDTLQDGRVHDDYRIQYLREHIEQMRLAIDDGVELIGYTPWSAMDLVSVSTGEVEKRYGFI